jgi:hypothetical protein
MKAQRGSRGIALLFNFGARWGWVVNAMPHLLYPQERDLVAIVQETATMDATNRKDLCCLSILHANIHSRVLHMNYYYY